MSGIFGIFNLDGKPVTGEILDRMMTPMAYWGPDGYGSWREGPIGLGHLMLRNTAESIHEKLPMKSRCGNFVISAGARIDNREELLSLFNIPFPEHPFTTDSTLILEAYKKWGEECPDHLLGDWTFAIWDVRKRKLFIARDHHGNTGLYYYSSSKHFAFSSCMKGLFALPGIPLEINEMRVAQVLVSWPVHGGPTAYKNILRLPPAHFMTVNQEKVNVQRYWYLENTPRLHLKSDREYDEVFLEIFTEAVRCRLRTHRPIGVTLSGGLDSGSVASIAAREMREKGQRLQAFSSVPFFDVNGLAGKRRFGDETPYIKATAEFSGNIDVSFVQAENVTPLKGLQRSLSLHDEPVHAAGNAYWIIALMEEAHNRGIGTLLTGQRGNATISWHGAGYFAQLAGNMHWRILLKELKAWGDINKKPLWRAFAGQIIKPLILQPVKRRINRLRPCVKDPWEEYSAVNRDFADRLNLTGQMYKHGHGPTFGTGNDTRQGRCQRIKPGRSIGGCLWQENGAGFAMEVRDPTADKRVLEFCLSIPDDQYVRDGIDRFLIRRAMKGILPPKVISNKLRGLQGADIGLRLYKSLDEIKSELINLESFELAREILDIEKMRHALLDLEQKVDIRNTNIATTILMRGLNVGLFLLRFKKNDEKIVDCR